MADPFNSRDGYTIGIPPMPFADANGNIYTNYAEIGNVAIFGDTVSTGNIIANVFQGTFVGNISANITVPGQNTWVLVNDNGQVGATNYLRFDWNAKELTVEDTIIANNYILGSGVNQFSSTSVVSATTASTATNQILYSVPAAGLCSIDVTVIATDTALNYRQISKLFAGILGTDVDYSEYGTIDVPISSPGVGDFKVVYDSGNVALTVSPIPNNLVNYKIMITSYKA